jgi:glycosyltransferase involved in cell wall biosynthesis
VNEINLSYIITTRNKLPYLQEAMTRLIAHIQYDEEIIVIDGLSTDGSAEYLNDLYKKGYIQQFLSEPDVCQAHGTNKGLLMAKGVIVKIITDDDAFYYPGIQKCKEFLLKHPEIDVLNGNVAVQFDHKLPIRIISERQNRFLQWFQGDGGAFWFSDHGLFFRRDKLPIIGLWHTGVICIDVEFTLRMTSARQLNIAWYTGPLSLALICKDSNNTRFLKTVTEDEERICDFYLKSNAMLNFKKLRMRAHRLSGKLVEIVFNLLNRDALETHNNMSKQEIISDRFRDADEWLFTNNSTDEYEFIYNDVFEAKRLLTDF